jgi:hypothetical protein
MERGRGWGQMIGGICLNKKIIHQQKLDSRNWTPQDDWQLNERKKEE